MSTFTSYHPQYVPPRVAARLLHDISIAIARAASYRLLGLDRKIETRVVVVADGTELVGALGHYTTNGCTVAGRTYDRLNVAIAHPGHADTDPFRYATGIITTLVHELAHAATLESSLRHGISGDGHGERFARVAEQLNLQVGRCSTRPDHFHTPALTAEGRARYQPHVARLAALDLATIRGVGLAGPDGLEGNLHSGLGTKSYFHSALGH